VEYNQRSYINLTMEVSSFILFGINSDSNSKSVHWKMLKT